MNTSGDLEIFTKCSQLMDEGKYALALALANSCQQPAYRASILIDAGSALGKSGKVREGAALFEELLHSQEAPEFTRSSLLYNAANGYYAIYSLRRRKRSSLVPPNDKDLRYAKRLYREAIDELSLVKDSFVSQVFVNYGNCLSQLGRFAEAIECYYEALIAEPTNGMAAGNLGIELEHCANITGRYRHEYLALAHELLERALSDSMHLRYGSYQAIQSFKQHLEYLENFLRAHQTPVLVPEPAIPVGKSKAKKEYLQFCIENNLFLNAWAGDPNISPGITDDIAFGPIVTPIADHHLVPELLRILNEIKEAYATARYLFFLSQRQNRLLDEISRTTLFFDNLDYDVNGLYTGLCKTAYVRAFDILDKVARIVNVYFGIGNRRDSFWSILAEKQSHGEDHTEWFAARPAIAATQNIGLFALADICIDYFERENVDLNTIDARRNKITHDNLPIRLFQLKEDPIEAVGLDDFAQQTRHVLRLARNSILYAVSAVNIAEARKEPAEKVGQLIYYHNPGQTFL